MQLNIQSEAVSLTATNSAFVDLAGIVRELNVSATNSSNIDMAKVNVNSAHISLMNSSSATIKTDTILEAKIANSSSLKYIGMPVIGEVDSYNSSSISRQEEH